MLSKIMLDSRFSLKIYIYCNVENFSCTGNVPEDTPKTRAPFDALSFLIPFTLKVF